MKRAKNVKVGHLVEVPVYEFAPMRTGWNGWIFRVGVVEKLYVSKANYSCAKVRFYFNGKEQTKGFIAEHVFEYKYLNMLQKDYTELKADEEAGKKVRYPEDMIFLAKNGFIK